MPKVAKLIAALFVIIFLISISSSSITAQGITDVEKQRLDKALQDYSYQFSKYESCHNQYITDRSSYLTFQTATAKNTAFLTTKDCLRKIYDVYVAYLRYIKEQGNTFTWNKNDTEKDEIFKTLDDQVTYFQDHQNNVDSMKTLDDTVPYAAQLKTYITRTTQPIIIKALASYEVAESDAAFENYTNLATDLRKFVVSRIDEKQYASFLANWDTEVEEIRKNAEATNAQARKALEKISSTSNNSSSLSGISKTTLKTKSELQRAGTIFAEILKTI